MPLPLIILGALAGVTGATASIYGGVEANKESKREARALEIERRSVIDTEREKSRRLVGAAGAAAAASGLEFTGTPLQGALSSAFDSLEEQARISTNYGARIRNVRKRGKAQLFSGILSGVTMGLSTISTAGLQIDALNKPAAK